MCQNSSTQHILFALFSIDVNFISESVTFFQFIQWLVIFYDSNTVDLQIAQIKSHSKRSILCNGFSLSWYKIESLYQALFISFHYLYFFESTQGQNIFRVLRSCAPNEIANVIAFVSSSINQIVYNLYFRLERNFTCKMNILTALKLVNDLNLSFKLPLAISRYLVKVMLCVRWNVINMNCVLSHSLTVETHNGLFHWVSGVSTHCFCGRHNEKIHKK